MTTYIDADGNAHSAAEEVQRLQAESTGTDVGNWTFGEPEPAPAAPPPEQLQPAPEYEPEPDYGLEPVMYDEQPVEEFDPFGDDPEGQIRGLIRDELGLDTGKFEEQEAWLEQQFRS